jgi:hypothetical protein
LIGRNGWKNVEKRKIYFAATAGFSQAETLNYKKGLLQNPDACRELYLS